MAGLVPAIHVLDEKGVDARHKAGHDAERVAPCTTSGGFERTHPHFDTALNRRSLDDASKTLFSSANLLAIDERRRAAILKLEQAQARRNAASKEIGEAKKNKDDARAQALMAEVNELKTGIPALEAEVKAAEDELNKILATIPNLPLDEVPDGADETGNVEHHKYGAKRDYAFTPKQHFELGEALGMMDFETAAKLSGARFVVLKGGLARLERALGQFMLDVHTGEHGYTEVNPPLLVRDDAMFGTAQLPKFEDDQFLASRRERFGRMEDRSLKIGRCLAQEASKSADLAVILMDVMLASRPWTNRGLALAHPDGRSSAHQSRSRIHRRRRPASDAAHRLHAVLPRGGRRGRTRHPRHDPPAPVHQGRAGFDHHSPKTAWPSTSACWPPPKRFCAVSACTTAS